MTQDSLFPDLRDILRRATVPEHSAAFMRAMSGGECLGEDGWLFFHADDWLMGIGYPLASAAGHDSPGQPPDAEAFARTMERVRRNTGATACWAVVPHPPEAWSARVQSRDDYYLLPAEAAIPPLLRGPVRSAAGRLTVDEDRVFSPDHRRLWAEFLARADMRPNVRELYARTEAALAASRASALENPERPALDLRLLNARNPDGSLAAALLLDYSPDAFCAYIIGAHSKERYAAHATDLLFAEMLSRARAEGKRFIHLGLGVNQGIRRFKVKWGATVALPYALAAWQETGARAGAPAARGPARDPEIGSALRQLLNTPSGLSKQQIFDSLPQQRDFAMIFEVRKGNAQSWLCGSAHFFRYSFEFAFRDLFADLHTVIFEGPLDEAFLAAVENSGKNPEPGAARIIDILSEEDIVRLERAVYGPEGPLARLFGRQQPRRLDVRRLLASARPWFAFFSVWVAFLERHGWRESVDLEAWNTAKDMGKAVVAMENLEEQLASLESVPPERIVDFFRRCDCWNAYSKRNVQSYLAGDLRHMMGSSIEFPTRTEQVINYRDQRFRERMRPFLEAGNCAVFVGAAHLVGLIPMLREDGFSVNQAYPGLWLKLKARLRALRGQGRAQPDACGSIGSGSGTDSL